jgi:succinylglutamic semialdehyde dehydrogenase
MMTAEAIPSGHFIAGAWSQGAGPAFSAIDPATDEPVFTGAEAQEGEVEAAAAAARGAFPGWALTPLDARIAVARRFAAAVEARAGALSEAISRTMGKVRFDADGEVKSVVGKVELSIRAQEERAGSRAETTVFGESRLDHRPYGVMAVFGPFNFPAHLPNGHIVPALLAGNTVVFKPSELAPGPGALLVQCWREAGLPEGVLNLVQGGRETGARLLGAPIEGVLFTGSVAAGQAIHRAFAGRPDIILALELGGNNPLIVWPPVDAGAAANLIAHSAFATTGQRCSCARRLILPEGPFGDAVIEALVALMDGLIVGRFDAEPQPFMGPLVSARAAAAAREGEARLLAGGGKAIRSLGGQGAFVGPALLALGESPAPDEELFAPLLQVIRVRTFEDAIARANATRFGLAAGLVSDDPALWEEARARLRAGILNWNRPTTGASSALPFGGPGLSGSGRPSAWYAADYCAWPVAMQRASKAAAISAPGLPA